MEAITQTYFKLLDADGCFNCRGVHSEIRVQVGDVDVSSNVSILAANLVFWGSGHGAGRRALGTGAIYLRLLTESVSGICAARTQPVAKGKTAFLPRIPADSASGTFAKLRSANNSNHYIGRAEKI